MAYQTYMRGGQSNPGYVTSSRGTAPAASPSSKPTKQNPINGPKTDVNVRSYRNEGMPSPISSRSLVGRGGTYEMGNKSQPVQSYHNRGMEGVATPLRGFRSAMSGKSSR